MNGSEVHQNILVFCINFLMMSEVHFGIIASERARKRESKILDFPPLRCGQLTAILFVWNIFYTVSAIVKIRAHGKRYALVL